MNRFLSAGVRCGVVAVLVALVFAIPKQTPAFAQQPPSTFESLVAEADKALAERRLDPAAALYESIRATAREQDDAFWEARGRFGLGRVSRARGGYAEAREHLTAALEAFTRLKAMPFVGVAAAELAAMEYSLGNDRQSAARYGEAIAAFEVVDDRLARARAVLGRLMTERSVDLATRERTYEELLEVTHASPDMELEAAILHSWGDALFNNGLYDRAIGMQESAAILADKSGDREQLARIYTSVGRLYRIHGQPQAAVRYQLKSLELAERSSASPRVRVQSLNAVGVAYDALGDRVEARKYYERALSTAESVGSDAIVDFIRAELGGLLVALGDAEPARKFLEGVLERGLDQHPSLRYGQLSSAYYKLGRFDDAREAGQHALDLCGKEDPIECVNARLNLADAELALGDEAAAVTAEDAALKRIEELHRTLAATDLLKQEFFHVWEPAYSLGIELRFRRGEFREALETAELARSRGFVDLLASHGIEAQQQTVPQLAALTTRGSATTIRNDAAVDAPDANVLRAIAARLRSTMIEYWVARDTVYIWTLAPDGAVSGTTAKIGQAKLEDLIRATSPFDRPSAVAGEATTATRGDAAIAISSRRNAAWRDLYDVLIKPIERQLPRESGARLTIVPHGPLLHLPFAGLRDNRGRYLIERYTIHSVPAAAILQFTRQRRHPDARTGSLLLVADPAPLPKIAGEPPLPRIPGSIEEARSIARLVPSSRRTLLEAENATEARFREALPSRAVVHFATHAIVRDADPMGSFLALGTRGNGDGRLTAQRIYGLPLDADLVVLSACRSGDGMVRGDGIAGLARAFFYAGAASVVVSVWDVADAPTSRLLPEFYRAWLNGADKARALRAAQLQLIRDLRAGRVKTPTALGQITIPEAPAFWAGFVLLGEPE